MPHGRVGLALKVAQANTWSACFWLQANCEPNIPLKATPKSQKEHTSTLGLPTKNACNQPLSRNKAAARATFCRALALAGAKMIALYIAAGTSAFERVGKEELPTGDSSLTSTDSGDHLFCWHPVSSGFSRFGKGKKGPKRKRMIGKALAKRAHARCVHFNFPVSTTPSASMADPKQLPAWRVGRGRTDPNEQGTRITKRCQKGR